MPRNFEVLSLTEGKPPLKFSGVLSIRLSKETQDAIAKFAAMRHIESKSEAVNAYFAALKAGSVFVTDEQIQKTIAAKDYVHCPFYDKDMLRAKCNETQNSPLNENSGFRGARFAVCDRVSCPEDKKKDAYTEQRAEFKQRQTRIPHDVAQMSLGFRLCPRFSRAIYALNCDKWRKTPDFEECRTCEYNKGEVL